jgi:hypothetical protein
MADNEKKKFSISMFLIKLTSRAFWVWLITSGITGYVLWRILEMQGEAPAYTWMAILLGIWGGTAVLFIGGNVLIDALSKAVEKADIKLQTTINASANTSITGSAAGTPAADSGAKK